MIKILFILLVAANVFASEQPVKLAARAIVREAKLEFGVRNNTQSNISGVIKFVNANGVELLANGFGFNLSPKKTEYRSIPIKNTTKDLPLLTCDVIIFNNEKSKLYSNVVKCKSGALFRNAGVSQSSPTFLNATNIKIHRNNNKDNYLSFYLQKKCVIKKFDCQFGNFPIVWNYVDSKNGIELIGKAVEKDSKYNGSNAVANVKLSIKQNGRGDCMVVFNYSLLKQLNDKAETPQISMMIPRCYAEDDLATLKFNNSKNKLIFLDDASGLLNKSVEEFSIITKNDWMTFYLDSSYLNVWNVMPKTTSDKQSSMIKLVIKSRTQWKPPFLPNRSGTIQFFIHFPVGSK